MMKNLKKMVVVCALLLLVCPFIAPVSARAATSVKVGKTTNYMGPTNHGPGYTDASYSITSGSKYGKLIKITTGEGNFFRIKGVKPGKVKVKCTYNIRKVKKKKVHSTKTYTIQVKK